MLENIVIMQRFNKFSRSQMNQRCKIVHLSKLFFITNIMNRETRIFGLMTNLSKIIIFSIITHKYFVY